MKKTIILLSLLLLAMTASAHFGGGTGTPSNPYKITSKEQLKSITEYNVEGIHFTLSSPIEYFDEWETIEEFYGTFDGGFHIMTLDKPFVKDNYGIIQNLGIMIQYEGDGPHSAWEGGFGAIACNQYENAEINGCFVFGNIKNMGRGQIGGIVGTNNDLGVVFNCKSFVNIESNGEDVGGIVGYNNSHSINYPIIERCHVYGTIVGSKNVGGICGRTVDGFIRKCHTYAMIYGHENAGGLIGAADRPLDIGHSYVHGTVKGKRNIGGFFGFADYAFISPLSYAAAWIDYSDMEDGTYGLIVGNGNVDIEHIFYMDIQINEPLGLNNLSGNGWVNEARLAVYNTLNFMELNLYGTYPGYLTYPEDWIEPQYEEWWYYSYPTVEDFFRSLNPALFNQLVNWECFDRNTYIPWGSLVLSGNYKGNEDCTLFNIPSEEPPFFAGSGTSNDPYIIKTIEHLDNIRHYDGADVYFRLENDLVVNDFKQIREFTGVFDGNEFLLYLEESFIQDNRGTVKNLGALVTYVGDETELPERNIGVGGIVCKNWHAGVISRCFVYGSFTNTDMDCIGGIAGINAGLIKDCKAYVYINGTKGEYGGISGYGGGQIEGCYAHGTIIGRNGLGGISGIATYGHHKNCHSYVMISGENQLGGITARTAQFYNPEGFQGQFLNCYAQGVLKGKSIVGGLIGHGTMINYDGLSYSAVIVDNREMEGQSLGILVGECSTQTGYNRGSLWADTKINEEYLGSILLGTGTGISGSRPEGLTTNEMFSLNIGYPYANSTLSGYPEFEKDPEMERWRGFNNIESFLNHLDPTLLDKLVNWECFGLSSYTPWSEVVANGNHLNYKDCGSFEIWQKVEATPFNLISNEFTQETESAPLLNNNIKIYPNPTTGIAYIENKQENTEIIVYDLSGALIFKTNEQSIDMTSYPKGMYILNINGQMEKLVKQ